VSPSDQAAYRAAVDPWKRKADRERKEINHVRWHDGHVEVLLVPRGYGMSRAEPPEGALL
jgi:hypothetical protein